MVGGHSSAIGAAVTQSKPVRETLQKGKFLILMVTNEALR